MEACLSGAEIYCATSEYMTAEDYILEAAIKNFSPRVMAARRVMFFSLCVLSAAFLLWLCWTALSPGGHDWVDYLLIFMFALILPWNIIGFWNSTIGFLVSVFYDNPLPAVFPSAQVDERFPIERSTAILLCIRNESTTRLIRNLTPMLRDLSASPFGSRFHLYVLSDTNDLTVAQEEEQSFAALAVSYQETLPITYRRRTDNVGYKAGNIEDFCHRWGRQHEYMLTLDADSLMTADAIMRLVRIMEANPNLGILQGLVVGMPASSPFTRLFQFGMRLGMRSYTMGTAWWQGDCGPYWGHNAVIRLAPFIQSCALPLLPDRHGRPRHILSHDQVEAVLMRKAGFDVRVLPVEDGSYEENPPTMIEYMRRDLRWCEGNMQYVHLLGMKGIKWLSRFQLLNAVFMFLGSPAWVGMLVVGSVAVASSPATEDFVLPAEGAWLFWLVLVMCYLPKIASGLEVFFRTEQRKAFGGAWSFGLSFVLETLFSLVVLSISWFNQAVFLFGLMFGRRAGWSAQARDDHSISLATAARQFLPHTVVGVVLILLLAITHPSAVFYAAFMAGSLAISIPFAVVTSLPGLGRAMIKMHVARLPEEINPPAILDNLGLTAITLSRSSGSGRKDGHQAG